MSDALTALAQQYGADKPWKRGLFAKQRAVLASKHKRKAVRCSRRAGKTVDAAALLCDELERAGWDETVVYAAKTRGVAEGLVWGKLMALCHSRPLWTVKQSELQIWSPAGAKIQLVGLDKPVEIEKLRGLKMRAFVGDEPATYAGLLETLMVDIIEPALGDVRGSVTFFGTPGPTLSGYWYDISNGENPEWELHSWTLADNPHFKDAAEFLSETQRKNGWDDQHPTFRREYLGEWVDDAEARVYQYKPEFNDAAAIPQDYDAEKWVHTIGVDFGVNDPCAWVVLASHPNDKVAYAIHCYEQSGLIIDQASDITASFVKQFKPRTLVGDSGGLGKPYVDQFNARHGDAVGLTMVPAEKREKRAQIDIINTEFRTRRVRLCRPTANSLSKCLMNLPWADERRIDEHPLFPNHLSDALLYAHRHHFAYMHSAPDKRRVGYATPDSDGMVEDEERDLERQSGAAWYDR